MFYKPSCFLFSLFFRSMSDEADHIQRFLKDIFVSQDAGVLALEKKCKNFCSFYSKLMPQEKSSFLRILAQNYNVDQGTVVSMAQNVVLAQDQEAGSLLKAEERLRSALTPRYQQIFTSIGRIDGGVKFLVDMRADILHQLTGASVDQNCPYLKVLNVLMKELLAFWFSVGLLSLQRITWESPCDMVQKISEYEAVHPIRNWTDLKHRVGAYRRCFVFIHSSMPREPVVVLHTALTNTIPDSIHAIIQSTFRRSNSVETVPLEEQESLEDSSKIMTAVFYSITSTQKGLQGVDLGNYLVKRVVKELQVEFPHMNQFTSISPVPGFKDWLVRQINTLIHRMATGEEAPFSLFTAQERKDLKSFVSVDAHAGLEKLRKMLHLNTWSANSLLSNALKQPLLRLCAQYLYMEKRRGFALNPVANFHLGNGAVLWRLNWLADTSPRGLSQSCGIMVNYRYFLDATEENSLKYMETQYITASPQVTDLLHVTH